MSAVARPAGMLDALVGQRSAPAMDFLVVAALASYVVLFLAVRSATNACFFVLVLLALLHLAQQRAAFAAAWRLDGSRTLFAALGSVFAAAIAAKLLRGELTYADLNAPARFLLAGLLLLFLTAKRIQFVRILALALPLAILAAISFAPLGPEAAARWEGRFATAFVDPNTLGSYAVILTFMILLTIDAPNLQEPWRRGLSGAGIVAGVALAMLAASRGGWLAIAPLAVLWLVFRRDRGLHRLALQGAAVLVTMALAVALVPEVGTRGLGSAGEVRGWMEGSNLETSSGHRLSIWKLSLELVAARPLLGYGWSGVVAQLAQPEFATAAPANILYILTYGGPHNDLLMMALSFGVFGMAAFVALLFVPAAFFWRRRAKATGDARLACELGVCLTTGVFVCGLTNEMLSLKYLVSFYGLTVAGLAAQVLASEQTVAGTA